MRNPLRKRVWRDLKKDWKKYVVLFVLMAFMIGIASGVFVGNDSMKAAIAESYDKYNIEDGNFEVKKKITDNLKEHLEDGITIYEQFYKDATEISDAKEHVEGKVRLFKVRTIVNKPCIMEGRLPEGKKEIAIDRSHADNLGLQVGDPILVRDESYEIVGLIASPDYSCLFENNADLMFNALTFDIAFLSDEAWDAVKENIKYQYAFKYDQKPVDQIEEKKWSDELIEKIAVLCATGGYTSNEDEAKELETNIEKWTEIVEEASDTADALKARQEELEKRQQELQQQLQATLGMDPNVLLEMQNLQKDAEELQKEADAFLEREDEIQDAADHLKELEPYDKDTNEILDYVPSYANQSIHFAADDLGRDQAMMNVLVYIFIAVLAFVFAITTSNKIKEESAIIGTLRATGYTRKELIYYYILIPVVITIFAAIAGNILGYTYFKDVAVALYYNSYSLLKYETIWNAKAFLITTLIPLILMIGINFVVIYRLMKLSPLKFMRRDLSHSKRTKAIRLPSFDFINRFRLRILIQNGTNYLTLFLGLIFIAILLGFSFGLPETLDNYKNIIVDNMLANYQYVLKDYKNEDDEIIQTKTPGVEKFATTSLLTIDGVHVDESITVYGYEEKSQFIPINESLKDNEIYISSAYQKKFGYQIGDQIKLREKYERKEYEFLVKGIQEYPAGLAIFLPIESYNTIFDQEKDYFTGYFSNERITDISEDDIYTIMTEDDFTSLANQLDHSMGGFAGYISYACLLIGILVMYLLTKLIIEKNAVSISVIKVLGYDNKDVNRLYVHLTTIVVIVLSVLATILGVVLLGYFFRVMLYSMEGWFDMYISPMGIGKMVLIMLLSYFIVSYLDMWHIKKIPLTEALKNVE